MIVLNKKGNLEIVGVPLRELEKPIEKRQAGHYLLGKLNTAEIKLLSETFDDPGVRREIVVNIESPVICRFIFDDEDPEHVKRSWLKIDDLNLN